jgi:hypothetical protein
MEDADLEEIRAKRLAQLQSEYRVNNEFYMVPNFLLELIRIKLIQVTYITYFICIRRQVENLKYNNRE